jgi:IclR family transcriptional regulator, acetate operon repressor
MLAYGAAHLTRGQKLEPRTDKTITTEAALKSELATVRARGYAVTDEELEPGLIAVAAPIHGYDGAVIAAISVSAPTNRMTKDRVIATAERCMDEAAGLSAVLGYRQRASRNKKAGAA